MTLRTDTPADLLDMADRMRRTGAGDAEDGRRLHRMVEDACLTGEVTYDRMGDVYRHLTIHAGVVTPTSHERFLVCPVCEVVLDMPEKGE